MFERRKEIRNVDTIQANQLLQASTGSSTSKLSRRAQALDHLRLRREEGASGFYSHREDIAQAAESSSTSHDNGTAERRRKARSSSQRGAGSNGQSAREAADANGMTSVDASRQRRSRTTAAAGTSPDTARPYRRAQTGSGAESASAASRQRRKPQQATAKAASADVRQNSNRRPAGSNRPRTRTTSPAQRQIALWRGYGVYAFVAIMFVGCILGLAFFARPTASAFEKRDLTPFPTITIESFLDGSFFSDVSLWYADTYPAREPLVRADHALTGLYGIQSETQMIGGNKVADQLPPAGESTQPERTAQIEERETKEAPTEQVMQADIQDNIMSGLYVEGGAAYSVYYFDQYAVNTYADAVSKAAVGLDGIADVYSVLIPNNSGAILDDDVLEQLGGTNQKEAIEYFYSLMSEKVRTVDAYSKLRAHRDEYIYFRTDHHWTQLGAYYAYSALCEKKGIEPADISTWEEHDYAPFLGTFYAELGLGAMEANPDVVEAHIPTGTNSMTFWDAYGTEYSDMNVVADASDYDANSKYMCFIYGDQPLSRIDNPKVENGDVALVVKDSYGCAFVPCLVDSYSTIWVIDFRKTDENLIDFVKEHEVDDLIFMNNVTIAGTQTAAASLRSLV